MRARIQFTFSAGRPDIKRNFYFPSILLLLLLSFSPKQCRQPVKFTITNRSFSRGLTIIIIVVYNTCVHRAYLYSTTLYLHPAMVIIVHTTRFKSCYEIVYKRQRYDFCGCRWLTSILLENKNIYIYLTNIFIKVKLLWNINIFFVFLFHVYVYTHICILTTMYYIMH